MQPRTNPVGQNNCPLFQVGFVIYNSVASHKSNGWKRAAGLKSHGHFGFLVLNPPELRIPALDRVESASIKNDAVHSVTAQEVVQVFLLFSLDRKSTRLNSSHVAISSAVFCLNT